MVSVFTTLGLSEANARDAADVLVKSRHLRHRLARVPRLAGYVNRLRTGAAEANPEVVVVHELPSTPGGRRKRRGHGRRQAGDGDRHTQGGGHGRWLRVGAQQLALRHRRLLRPHGPRTRHDRLQHDQRGQRRLHAANGGRTGFFGTNPIAVAAPTGTPPAFVMDFATTVVASGKLQIAQRRGQEVPLGWIVDSEGNPSTNPADRHGGGHILPLGGMRETSGHKGYGLLLLVDILSGVLSGAAVGASAAKLTPEGAQAEQTRSVGAGSNTGHFFGALRVDGFRPLEEFKAQMDEMMSVIRSSERLPGWERIFVHGEPEWGGGTGQA